MHKLSDLIRAMAEQVLAQPTEKSSREAVLAALLLAHVAWNRVADPLGGDLTGHYRTVLNALETENPRFARELKSQEYEALIQDLVTVKLKLHPTDDRIIHVCGLTAQNNVRVEWRHRRFDGQA